MIFVEFVLLKILKKERKYMKITIMICLMMIPLDGTVLATRTFMDKSNLLLIEICF